MGIFEEFAYIKILFLYMLIPIVVVCLVLGGVALKLYTKHRYNLTFPIKKKIKLLLDLVGVLLLGAIFIVMLAFINAFVFKSSLEFTNKFAYYMIIISPLVPLIFMFNFVFDFFKTLQYKEKNIKIDKNEKFDINSVQKFDQPKETEKKEPVAEKIEEAPAEEGKKEVKVEEKKGEEEELEVI